MLKQTNHETKTLFLELFTQELIFNSKPKIEEPKEKMAERGIEVIKLPEIEEYIPSLKIAPKINLPVILKKPILAPILLKYPIRSAQAITKRPVTAQRPVAAPQTLHPLLQKKFVAPSRFPVQSKFTVPISGLPKIEEEVNLGKLNMFLVDKEVTMMECPGPNKFVLVKKAEKINLTKINLSQKEIDEIIENFSEKARIPIMEGIFKANIGNLTISAVISGFVGSRFIIYKTSPYSLIE